MTDEQFYQRCVHKALQFDRFFTRAEHQRIIDLCGSRNVALGDGLRKVHHLDERIKEMREQMIKRVTKTIE